MPDCLRVEGEPGTERRLAAILAADVVGYSRLMGEDEAGTLDALKALRKDLVAPQIAEHKGRVVKLMGDGLSAEFGSVVDAVECAVAIRDGMTQRCAGDQTDMKLRIGVNLGDVIIAGNDIHGDGVNAAARLETLADPGGACISGTVHEHVTGKLDHGFVDDGEQTVKNIARPVHAWRWSGSKMHAGGVAASRPPLPDKPSIAVLPLKNMSGDPEQECFSDGITEDIITELSRFKSLFVIARSSSFTFKGKAVDIKDVGRKLGVAYVVEGSIRKAGNRVRVTAQLIEAMSGNYPWAERYDKNLGYIFAIQEEITRTVVASIAPQVEMAEIGRVGRVDGVPLSAYEFVLKSQTLFYESARAGRPEIMQQAIDFGDRALELGHRTC